MLFDDPLSYDYDYTKQKYKNIYKAVYMRWGGSAAEIVTYQLQKTLIPPLFQYFFLLHVPLRTATLTLPTSTLI